ncbi:hypothetical protein C8Q74DRAFT_1228695 [Fomes fomentarius]|nr:hypothetical protein C8Q74DRAFT_1228695 [Fomes fomentarius]
MYKFRMCPLSSPEKVSCLCIIHPRLLASIPGAGVPCAHGKCLVRSHVARESSRLSRSGPGNSSYAALSKST